MRVLNLGVGVQSSTIAYMAVRGELEIDAAIFADTGWEPRRVYKHLWYMAGLLHEAAIPLYVVSAGNIRRDALSNDRFVSLPLHVRNPDGGSGIVKRQCTSEYKIAPIRRKLRALMKAASAATATQLFGISLDELERMRKPDVRYLRHEYPLVDRRMTRGDCKLWIERHGYNMPPRSACIGCPFHSNAEWREIRAIPDEWADAIDFDEAIRNGHAPALAARFDGQAYVHHSKLPLAAVDLTTPQERGQLSFLDECAGVCGV